MSCLDAGNVSANVDKIVFARTLKKVEWNNTRLMKDKIFVG